MLRDDSSLAEEVRQEILECDQDLRALEGAIVREMIPRDQSDDHSAVLEVRAAAGGTESSLFTSEMFAMYQKYAAYRKWGFETLSVSESELGGYKQASASVTGTGVYGRLKYEAGVHRVQRVPATETHGRLHTSTMSVAVLPQPRDIEVVLNTNDIKVDTFRAAGAGGQHVNTTDSAVRLTHKPTGIVVSIQDQRSQHQNKAKAMKLLQALIYEQQRKTAVEERDEKRRQQIGSGERSERIRTYNFPQDRVTEHRLGVTVWGVAGFMSGTDSLDNLLEQLSAHDLQENLTRLME
ncbi:Peptide chain release factor 1 [Geodia barretti]|uniref:Peptide chain release factor 1 n=2 Tax=Geodia barretti TaxID=519541 RepID=A0AA35TMN6_GEOBA|nr:Peptide chain release factor 1 [Geodia barretti]